DRPGGSGECECCLCRFVRYYVLCIVLGCVRGLLFYHSWYSFCCFSVVWLFVSFCYCVFFFFFQAEDGIRDLTVTGVQTCALPIFHTLGDRSAPDGSSV